MEVSRSLDRQCPLLLRTCRQVRVEASPMYYVQNHIVWTVCSFDIRPCLHFRRLLVRYQGEAGHPQNLSLRLCDFDDCEVVHKLNLIRWLGWQYHDPEKVPAVPQDADLEGRARTLARRCFGVVNAMRGKPRKMIADVWGVFSGAMDLLDRDDRGDFEGCRHWIEDDRSSDWTDVDYEDDESVRA